MKGEMLMSVKNVCGVKVDIDNCPNLTVGAKDVLLKETEDYSRRIGKLSHVIANRETENNEELEVSKENVKSAIFALRFKKNSNVNKKLFINRLLQAVSLVFLTLSYDKESWSKAVLIVSIIVLMLTYGYEYISGGNYE